PGIGEKGALELLTKYETLDNVLANIDEITGAKQKKLVSGRELALTSRELARLKSDMDIVIDCPAAVPGHFDAAEVADLCRECGFRQLAKRIELLMNKLAGATPRVEQQPAKQKSFNEADDEQPPVDQKQPIGSDLTTASSPNWNANYRTIATTAELS